jgi:hypothetical protein
MAKKNNWAGDAQQLVTVGISLGIGFGLMGYILFTFLGAMTGPGATFVNDIINAFTSAITTILPAVITIAFIMLLYVVVKKSGVLDSNTKES